MERFEPTPSTHIQFHTLNAPHIPNGGDTTVEISTIGAPREVVPLEHALTDQEARAIARHNFEESRRNFDRIVRTNAQLPAPLREPHTPTFQNNVGLQQR